MPLLEGSMQPLQEVEAHPGLSLLDALTPHLDLMQHQVDSMALLGSTQHQEDSTALLASTLLRGVLMGRPPVVLMPRQAALMGHPQDVLMPPQAALMELLALMQLLADLMALHASTPLLVDLMAPLGSMQHLVDLMGLPRVLILLDGLKLPLAGEETLPWLQLQVALDGMPHLVVKEVVDGMQLLAEKLEQVDGMQHLAEQHLPGATSMLLLRYEGIAGMKPQPLVGLWVMQLPSEAAQAGMMQHRRLVGCWERLQHLGLLFVGNGHDGTRLHLQCKVPRQCPHLD